MGHDVTLVVTDDLRRNRLTVFFRLLPAFTIRYHAQTQAYYSLVTPQHPSFNVGLEASPASAASQNV